MLYQAPGFGYFIKDNLSISGGLTFNISNNYNVQHDPISGATPHTYNSNVYGINLNSKYYKNISDKIYFFIQGGIYYSYITIKNESPSLLTINNNGHQNMYSINFNPGLTYFYNTHFGITAYYGGLGYSYYNTIYKDSPNNYHYNGSYFNFSFGLKTLYLGVSYCF